MVARGGGAPETATDWCQGDLLSESVRHSIAFISAASTHSRAWLKKISTQHGVAVMVWRR